MAQAQGSNVQIIYEPEAVFGKTPAGTGAKKLYWRPGTIFDEDIPLLTNDAVRSNRNPIKPVRDKRHLVSRLEVNLSPQIGTLLRGTLGGNTTTGAGPYTHTIKIGDPLSFTTEMGLTDLGVYFVYNGQKFNDLTLGATPSGYQTASFNGVGANEAQVLKYDAQSGNFTAGLTVTGGSSGATGIILADKDNGTTGFLTLINVTGTFQDNEAITDTSTGSATVNGTLGGASYATSPTDPGETPFDGLGIGTIEEGGSSIATVTAVNNIRLENNLDTSENTYTVGGYGIRSSLPAGKVRVSGELVALFDSMTLYNKALRYQESSLKVKWQHGTGSGTAGNESLEMYIPELVYKKRSPEINGDKGILFRGEFEAYYDNGAGATALQLVLKNAEATI